MPQSGTNAARPASAINAKLNQRLTAYVAAASAAGVAVLAAAPQAEAKVVYTATRTVILSGVTTIDLNHDGTADFSIGFHTLSKDLALAVGPAVKGNEILLGKNGEVGVGVFGQPVGPGDKFAASTGDYGWMIMAVGVVGQPPPPLPPSEAAIPPRGFSDPGPIPPIVIWVSSSSSTASLIMAGRG
jgi:hypothetical protein